MGSEWERKRAAGFKKQLDRELIKLGTPDLFTQQLTRAPRIVAADIVENAPIKVGQDLIIQKIGSRLAVMCGPKEIGQLSDPKNEVVTAVESSFGFAKGIVEVFHEDALVAEISIC